MCSVRSPESWRDGEQQKDIKRQKRLDSPIAFDSHEACHEPIHTFTCDGHFCNGGPGDLFLTLVIFASYCFIDTDCLEFVVECYMSCVLLQSFRRLFGCSFLKSGAPGYPGDSCFTLRLAKGICDGRIWEGFVLRSCLHRCSDIRCWSQPTKKGKRVGLRHRS